MKAPLRETPFGPLYPPQPLAWQLLSLAGTIFASLLCGWIPRVVLTDLSADARVFLHIPFVLVFILGYAGWAARLQALGMELLGRSLLKAFWRWLCFRRKPDLKQLLPDENKLMQLLVRGQKAASAFCSCRWDWPCYSVARRFLSTPKQTFSSGPLWLRGRQYSGAGCSCVWGGAAIFPFRKVASKPATPPV